MSEQPMTIGGLNPRHTIEFRGPGNRVILFIDFDADPVEITVNEGVTLTEAAQHFIDECRRLVGAGGVR